MSISGQSRQTLDDIKLFQQHSLTELLRYAWHRSAFYRDYYSSHGVRESDLAEITVTDLPLLSKKTLMENFDRAVTNPGLKKQELDKWFEEHPDPRDTFSNDFVVIHSSGSSGVSGIFVYDQKAWRLADVALARFLTIPEHPRSGKIKAAFYIASHGHFAGVSSARSLAPSLYQTLIVSLLEPRERVVKELNAFQPHRLHGYSNSVAELAELAIRRTLQINPGHIVVSGDKLTAGMEATIRQAWEASIHNLYAAGESKHIAIKTSGQDQMIVLDELNILEVLGNDNRAVSPGEVGRVVLTNLYNYTQPILRYELEDNVIAGKPEPGLPFTTIGEIQGRTYEALPIVSDNGEHDQINPHVLTAYRFPGVEKIQYVAKRANEIEILYVGTDNVDQAIRNDFYQVLSSKGASLMPFRVRRVDEIDRDPRTGKLHRVKIEGNQERGPSGRRPSEITAARKPELRYKLVRNRQAQYSLIPADSALPHGWLDTDKVGSKADCLQFVKELAPSTGTDGDTICVQNFFENQVRRAPNRLALAFGEQTLTYEELNKGANRLARCLRSLGVGPNEKVAICLPRSLDAMLGIFATLKAGGAWLPLDFNQPKARQEAILQNARCEVMLTHTALETNLAHNAARTIFLDKEWPSISQFDDSDLENRSTPADLAYVMHTSGSTGQPKGVLITRANLSHYVRSIGQALGIGSEDAYLHTANFAFSSSVRQLMVPLCWGAAIVIAGSDEIQHPVALFETIKRRQVTILDVVPTYWRNCIDVLVKLDDRTKASLLDNQLRLILTTGEPLPPHLPEKWVKQFSDGTRLVNMFGQTETTGTVATYPIPAGGPVQAKTVPIGGPIPNTQIYLLDDQQQPVPVGSDGEIYVGGPGLGLGYLSRPDLNADKFVPNPFGSTPGARLYRTGDLARFRHDGDMEFVSRIDDQVKVRGIRIELEEIRSILSQHPEVRQSTVIAAEDRSGHNRLVAYVAPKAEEVVTPADLRAFLKRKLPDYMIPAAFLMMDALPLTPSGKVNRQALPPAIDATAEKTYVAPRTHVEEALAAIWAEVLGLPRVGIHDDFFALGGHSLSVTQIIFRVGERFDLQLSVRSLFEAPTVAEMAAIVPQRQAKEAPIEDVAAMLADVESLSDEEAQKLIADEKT